MSDEKIYIKLLKTGNNLGAFKVTADNYTTPTVSLISPNEATSGYDVSKTSFVVGSDRLDDDGSVTTKDIRMLFDKTKGAFRAGTVVGSQWDSANRGTNSTALGNNNTASGESSIAVGNDNIASGKNAFVAGTSSSATKDNSFSFGDNSDALGLRSVSIGYTSTASASDAIALGSGCLSSSANSITLGQQCLASTAANATAIGQYCTATGANSFAIGYGTDTSTNANKATGTGSVAIGYKNNVVGANSVAIGMNNTINADQCYAIGNGSTLGPGALGSVSISTSNGVATNTITGLGNIAIGGGCLVASAGAFIWRSPNNQMLTTISQTVNDGSAHFVCTQDGIFRLSFGTQDGAVTTGSSTGFAWSGASDINLKENLVEHTYSDTLDKIMDMPIYTYNFKTVAPGIKSIGPVAQDFNRLFPSDKDQLSIVERDMCGVALAGVKGVKLRLDSLSTAQQSQINTLIESLTTANTQITTLSASLTAAIVRITALEGEAVTLKSKVSKLEKD